MTDLEERLRHDLKTISGRVGPESLRPLRVPPPGRWRATARWLAPVAAVAAVIGVIAGVSVAGHSAGPTGPAAQSGAPAPGTMPRRYVTVQETFARVTTATVRDSVTGAALASVRLPLLYPAGLREITAAADDRTFVITDGNSLFLLRVSADGRSARLRQLPIAVPDLGSVALSPDGRTLAIESQSCTEVSCQYSSIRLVSLATAATRTWSTRYPAKQNMWISWDGNRRVFFSWLSARTVPPASQQSGYRLLNVTAPGSDLLAAPLLPVPLPPLANGYYYEQPAFVIPGRSAVITSTMPTRDQGSHSVMIMKIVELSTRTGQLLRVLYTETYPDFNPLIDAGGCSVLSLGPSGVHALIECPAPQPDRARSGRSTKPQVTGPLFGRLDNGRFTPLPGLTGDTAQDAAW
jgi:hypothetical protein